ncbi:hypothetical protein ACSQ67_026255 [Phaseolus vulgaris]
MRREHRAVVGGGGVGIRRLLVAMVLELSRTEECPWEGAINMRHEGIEHMAGLLEKRLASELSKMTLEEALTLARAFSHHLTLMGIVETHHRAIILVGDECVEAWGKVHTDHPIDFEMFKRYMLASTTLSSRTLK